MKSLFIYCNSIFPMVLYNVKLLLKIEVYKCKITIMSTLHTKIYKWSQVPRSNVYLATSIASYSGL